MIGGDSVQMQPWRAQRLRLQVRSSAFLTSDVRTFEFVSADGSELPAFTPGSSIKIKTPAGAVRRYSLCNSPLERERYCIAVKRCADGKGGSINIVAGLRDGDVVYAAPPQNEFNLSEQAPRYLFVAGGIGITPIRSMMKFLDATRPGTYKLHYLAREPYSAAFASELLAGGYSGEIVMHFSRLPGQSRPNLAELLRDQDGAELYCCGPEVMMRAVQGAARHWAPGTVHFENFAGPGAGGVREPFTAELRRTGITLSVGATDTLLDVANANGVNLPFSCKGGTCGTCKVGVAAGDIDHRDFCLTPDEQRHAMMPCVSRGQGHIVIDA